VFRRVKYRPNRASLVALALIQPLLELATHYVQIAFQGNGVVPKVNLQLILAPFVALAGTW